MKYILCMKCNDNLYVISWPYRTAEVCFTCMRVGFHGTRVYKAHVEYIERGDNYWHVHDDSEEVFADTFHTALEKTYQGYVSKKLEQSLLGE